MRFRYRSFPDPCQRQTMLIIGPATIGKGSYGVNPADSHRLPGD